MNVLKLSRSSIRVAENERDVKVVSQDKIRESDDRMMEQETDSWSLSHRKWYVRQKMLEGKTGSQKHTWEAETQCQMSGNQCEGLLYTNQPELKQHNLSYSFNTSVASADPCSDWHTQNQSTAF